MFIVHFDRRGERLLCCFHFAHPQVGDALGEMEVIVAIALQCVVEEAQRFFRLLGVEQYQAAAEIGLCQRVPAPGIARLFGEKVVQVFDRLDVVANFVVRDRKVLARLVSRRIELQYAFKLLDALPAAIGTTQ